MHAMRQVQPRSLVSLELKSTSYTHDIKSYNGTSIQGTPSGLRQVSLEWGSLYNICLQLYHYIAVCMITPKGSKRIINVDLFYLPKCTIFFIDFRN